MFVVQQQAQRTAAVAAKADVKADNKNAHADGVGVRRVTSRLQSVVTLPN
jgi:hypothetical protein